MRYVTRKIIFPEGDSQEIEWGLRFGQLVDVSGRPLELPLPTVRTLAYRVRAIKTDETRNEDIVSYSLEQLFPDELQQYTSEGQ